MYTLINKHRDDVIQAIDKLDPNSYLSLARSLKTCNPAKDTDFQDRYREYWRMYAARLGEPFYQAYFTLLAECTRTATFDIAAIIDTLIAKGGRGPQFSFATKLAHMVNPHLPVYDSFVTAFYFYQPPSPQDSDLDSLHTFYHFLCREYEHILANGLLEPALSQLRRTIAPIDTATDERLIDWLIWGWVSMMRRRDRHVVSLYE